MTAPTAVGFDRFLRSSWLDRALQLAAAEVEPGAARAQLEEDLEGEVAGRRSQVETARLLQQIWLEPPRRLRPIRDHAVGLYREGGSEPLPLHWGMAMAAYPFFGAVVEAAGRQLRLHGGFSAPTVLRRVGEAYGERPTVRRATQRVLQSVVEWGVLLRRPDGEYVQSARRPVSAGVSGWLVAATLHGVRSGVAPLDDLHDAPALFPFELVPAILLLRSGLYDVVRQGGGMDVAVLHG